MVQTILEADFLSYFQLIFFEAPIYIPRTDFSGTFVASTFKTLTVLKHLARPSPFRTSPHFMRTLLKTVAKRKVHFLPINPLTKNVVSIAQNCSETQISFSAGEPSR